MRRSWSCACASRCVHTTDCPEQALDRVNPSVAAYRPGTSDRTRTRRDDALSGIRLLLLHPWVCLLSISCLTPARPHASDCSRLIVPVLPAHVVISSVEHCGMAVLPAFAITTFSISSVALHVFKVIACCTVISARDVQSPYRSCGCSCSLRQASPAVSSLTVKIVISVLPSSRSRILDLACPNTQSSLLLVSPKNQPTHALQWWNRPERSSGRLSRPRSPRVCLTRPGRAVEQRVSRLLQLSCHPASAFKLRHPFVLNFPSICLLKSVLL